MKKVSAEDPNAKYVVEIYKDRTLWRYKVSYGGRKLTGWNMHEFRCEAKLAAWWFVRKDKRKRKYYKKYESGGETYAYK